MLTSGSSITFICQQPTGPLEWLFFSSRMMDIDWVRSQFPVFKQNKNMVFMDNAGGSQTVKHAMDAIVNYLTHLDVQLGASYSTSVQAAEQLATATQAIQTYVNAERLEEVIVGPSSTALVRVLSLCISQQWSAGDEVIITDVDHEANRAAWLDLQQRGMVVKVWRIRPENFELHSDDLLALLSDRTRLVCFTHVSNILGTINPIAKWTQLVHDHGALVCVDAVAYAPHRLIDVQAWDVDFYFFSTYKTFGPHQGVLYGKYQLLQAMPGINHAFIQSIPYKFQPGNVNYELCYAMGAVVQYLCELGAQGQASVNRKDLTQAYAMIAKYEADLLQPLLNYFRTVPEIHIIGVNNSHPEQRVATLSLVHDQLSSAVIIEHVDDHGIGIRFGDFYAVQLIDHLGLRAQQGVVRISLAHYNTSEEVDRLIQAFKLLF